MKKYYKEDGEEIPAIVLVEEGTQPEGFSEVTDAKMIYNCGCGRDYLYTRSYIKNLLDPDNNWGALSNDEKDLLIDLYAYGTADAGLYLVMTKGMTPTQAQGYIVKKYSEHVVKDAESCSKRSKSSNLTAVVLKYLNPAEATDFLNITEGLDVLYRTRSIKGLNDGSSRAGLFDFIESTNDYTGQGLEEQGYTLNIGTWNDLRSELMDILRHGNYGG